MNSHIFTNKNGNILMREFERVLDFIINKDKLYKKERQHFLGDCVEEQAKTEYRAPYAKERQRAHIRGDGLHIQRRVY